MDCGLRVHTVVKRDCTEMMTNENEDRSGELDFQRVMEPAFDELSTAELEDLTIETIQEYRRRLAALDEARRAWDVAGVRQETTEGELRLLQKRHGDAMIAHRAYQLVLNDLVDRLGYIPQVESK